jgi:hypothetical protein
VSHPPNE